MEPTSSSSSNPPSPILLSIKKEPNSEPSSPTETSSPDSVIVNNNHGKYLPNYPLSSCLSCHPHQYIRNIHCRNFALKNIYCDPNFLKARSHL